MCPLQVLSSSFVLTSIGDREHPGTSGEQELGMAVDEPTGQPRTRDPVDLRVLPCDPLHGPSFRRVHLHEHPHDPPSSIRVPRQEVDDARPVIAGLVAVARQPGRDRVAVGLVTDQDAAEVGASLRGRASKGGRGDQRPCQPSAATSHAV
jgi:hypothetical protein